ncbi:hypothetical protein BJV78DRAFT_1361401 [Lactifluus subvellereus]|nr:hypothetical protein BJV78DRAFT_1361401 [Lactifluus subvellereus]
MATSTMTTTMTNYRRRHHHHKSNRNSRDNARPRSSTPPHRYAPAHRGGGARPRQGGQRWALYQYRRTPGDIEPHDDDDSNADNPVPDLGPPPPFDEQTKPFARKRGGAADGSWNPPVRDDLNNTSRSGQTTTVLRTEIPRSRTVFKRWAVEDHEYAAVRRPLGPRAVRATS